MGRLTCGRFLSGAMILTTALGLTGCCCYGPDRSVQVVLRGASDSARWQATETLLPTLVDDPPAGAACWTAWGGGPPERVHLGPVADPKAFAGRIRFGTVEKIDGRTIYVKVDEDKARAQAVVVQVIQFVEHLPDTVRLLLFIGRVKAIAWWTGRPEGDVFWSEFSSDLRQASTVAAKDAAGKP